MTQIILSRRLQQEDKNLEENNNQQNENNQNGNGRKSPNKSFLFMLLVSVGLTLLFYFVYSKYQTGQKEEISYSQFLDMIEEGTVESVKIYSSTVEITPKKDKDKKSASKKIYYAIRISDINLVDRLETAKEKGELDYTAVDESSSAIIGNILSWVLMIGVFYLIIWLFMRSMSKGGGMMGVGKSNAKMYVEKKQVLHLRMWQGRKSQKNL